MATNYNKPVNSENALLAISQLRENIESTIKALESISPDGDIPDKAKRWNPLGYYETYNLAQTAWENLLFSAIRMGTDGVRISDAADKGITIDVDLNGYPEVQFSDFLFFKGLGTGKFPISMTESGKVGINKQAPTYDLDVVGDINFTGSLFLNGVLYDVALGGAASVLYVDTQDALKQDLSEKGQANGYASLDGNGLVPSAQLPSFVDDVLEFANLAAFPGPGETGKIYIAQDTGYQYRWSGAQYIDISGKVDSVDGQTGSIDLSGDYLGINAKAADSNLLDGLDSTAFATSGHNHDGVYATSGHNHDAAYLGINAQAADSALVGGISVSNLLKLSYASQTIDGGQSTTLILKSNNDGASTLELYGDTNGTGRLYVGQSSSYGGGLLYEGDGIPTPFFNDTLDQLVLYRKYNGVYSWTARNPLFTNDWVFRNKLSAVTFEENGVSLASKYLGIGAKAADSDKLDGLDSDAFATSGHNHDATYLGINAKAADSDKLDGLDSTAYLRSDAADSWTETISWGGATGATAINLNNADIVGINKLKINDPGEGIEFGGGSAGTIFLNVIDDADDNRAQLTGNFAQDLVFRLFNSGAGNFNFEADKVSEGGESLEDKYSLKDLTNFDYPFDLRAELDATARGSFFDVSEKYVVVGSNSTANKVHILNRRTGVWTEVSVGNYAYLPGSVVIDDSRDMAWIIGSDGSSSSLNSRDMKKINLKTSSVANSINLPSISNSGVSVSEEPRGASYGISQDDQYVYASYAYHDSPGQYSSNIFKINKDDQTGIAVELEDEALNDNYNGAYHTLRYGDHLYVLLALQRISGTYSHRAKLYKLNIADLSTDSTLVLNSTVNASFRLIQAGKYLYAISGSDGKASAAISRIDPVAMSQVSYSIPAAQEAIGWVVGAFDGRYIWCSAIHPATTDLLLFDTFNKSFSTFSLQDLYNTAEFTWSGNGQKPRIVKYFEGRIWGSIFKDDSTDQCVLFSPERSILNV